MHMNMPPSPKGPAEFDSVVLLHAGDWTKELTSNRWHYTKYFSGFTNVVVIQPTSDSTLVGTSYDDSRFPNTKIVYVGTLRPIIDSPKRVAIQISLALKNLGFAKLLFWLSAPIFWNVSCYLEQGPIVFHATEDYSRLAVFNPHPAATYLRQCAENAAKYADITLSVSTGVSASLMDSVHIRKLVQSSNGYSSEDYGKSAPSTVVEWGSVVAPIVYCGNINKRLNLHLLNDVARSLFPRTLILAGPVSLPRQLLELWEQLLLAENVHYLGSCTSSQLN
jgi:hypothetical protein